MRYMRMTVFCCLALGVAALGFADQRGEDLAKKSFDLKDAEDSSELLTMTLIDKSGGKKVRKLEVYSRELPNGTKQDYMRFLDPADVVGTKFLSSKPKGGDTEQSLWLPALGKVRKIASSGKDGDFVNSDMSYYDMEEREFEDATYTFLSGNETLPEKAFEGMKFSKVTFVPVDKTSPYSKTVVWINEENFYPYRIDAYDKKDGALLKTILVVKLETVSGILVPMQTMVINNKKGSKTLLQVANLKINQGVSGDLFTQKNLEK